MRGWRAERYGRAHIPPAVSCPRGPHGELDAVASGHDADSRSSTGTVALECQSRSHPCRAGTAGLLPDRRRSQDRLVLGPLHRRREWLIGRARIGDRSRVRWLVSEPAIGRRRARRLAGGAPAARGLARFPREPDRIPTGGAPGDPPAVARPARDGQFADGFRTSGPSHACLSLRDRRAAPDGAAGWHLHDAGRHFLDRCRPAAHPDYRSGSGRGARYSRRVAGHVRFGIRLGPSPAGGSAHGVPAEPIALGGRPVHLGKLIRHHVGGPAGRLTPAGVVQEFGPCSPPGWIRAQSPPPPPLALRPFPRPPGSRLPRCSATVATLPNRARTFRPHSSRRAQAPRSRHGGRSRSQPVPRLPWSSHHFGFVLGLRTPLRSH